MCFSKVKLSYFNFYFFLCIVFFLFFKFHSLISMSRLLDTKLMASTQPFKVNDFGGLQLTD